MKESRPVFTALIVEIRRKSKFHVGQFRELDDLVFAFSASYTAVNFLQADEIRALSVNHIGNALEVQLLVHADADVNVVRHHAERLLSLCRKR